MYVMYFCDLSFYIWRENPCELGYLLDTVADACTKCEQDEGVCGSISEVGVTNTSSYTNLTSTGQLQYTWINNQKA